MKSQSYSNASNARRAALKAGFTVDQFKIVPNGSTGCSFEVPDGIEPGVAALATMSPTDAREANNARLAGMGLIAKPRPSRRVPHATIAQTPTPTPAAEAATTTQESAVSKTKSTKKTAPKTAAAPRGKVIDILKLASREKGVSREELNQLTDWKGAPWKWLFKNPKKTGYCDRWGYSFRVGEGKDGEVRYFTEKKAA